MTKEGGILKKDIFFYVSCLVLAIVVIASVPGYLMQEADQVRFEEEVLLGDASMVEGVKITSHSHYDGKLFWDTEYTAGVSSKIETEHVFSTNRKITSLRHLDYNGAYWYEEGGYRALSIGNGLSGGWSVTSYGGLSIENGNIQRRELEPAYEALAEETASGEKKSSQIFLSNYLEYFPVNITLDDNWVGKKKYDIEALDAAYTEFFKIPVSKSAKYVITVEKNEAGDIVTLGGGNDEQSIYSWNTVCAASDTDLYFTFDRYSMSGAKMDTSQIPGGYGVYRQPYSTVGDELVFDTEKLSMVYSLGEETYREGSIFLDVTEAGELLILTDQEETTRLQVVDLETMELLQKVELTRRRHARTLIMWYAPRRIFLSLDFTRGIFPWCQRRMALGMCSSF